MLSYQQLLTSRYKAFYQTLTCRILVRCISSNTCTPVRERFNWLKDHAPRFGISGQNVTVLDGPQHFYNALKTGIDNAKKRVVLASLYIGEGPMEQALIDSLLNRCCESKSCGAPVDIQVLLDYTRGSRGVTNSRTLLLPLLEHYRETSRVALYHTPNLRGILRTLIPERYNEVIGLSHLKVYLFDDDLVMSGANLSNDYFTNRQDRYILFRNVPEVSHFFCQLVTTISTFSLQLEADNSINLHPSFQIHPFKDDIKTFKKEASKLVKSVIDPINDGGHQPPRIPEEDNLIKNSQLSDAITEKFTSLSNSIPSKQGVMSRNLSSLSQDFLGLTNTATEPFVSNNSEHELKLLESLTVNNPHIQICETDNTAVNKHILTNSIHGLEKGTSSSQKSFDIGELLVSNNVNDFRKHKSSPQPVVDSDSICKSNKSSQYSLTENTHESILTKNKHLLTMNAHQSKELPMKEQILNQQSTSNSFGHDGLTGGDNTVGSITIDEITGGEVDTWLYPLIQMGPLGITVDQEVTEKLLQTSGEDSTCVLASGYFNLVEEYLDLITNSHARYCILMASPQVNGFYKAKGFPGFIPDAYTFIARKFYNRMKRTGQLARIKLFEYHKQNWTFHAKGLWLCINGQQLPSLTLVGSPNFGYRSVHRDLEAQVALVTENTDLQHQLHEEHVRLFNKSKPVSKTTFDEPERKEPLWVQLIVPVIKNFF